MNGTISKVTENLLRRIAHRQGYDLTKSRGRDPAGTHFGEYQLTNIETGEVYLDAATGGVWMSAPTVARALDREDLMTNGRPGHVSDPRPPTAIPVIGLRLVPRMDESQDDASWVVESGAGGMVATMSLSDDKARDLADKIYEALGEREQKA
jgi:hypothetical protein